MAQKQRPRAELGDLQFEWRYPKLDTDTSGDAARHKLLPESPDEPKAEAIQPLGRAAASYTLRGKARLGEVNRLDEMVGTVRRLVHPRHTGNVYIQECSTSSLGEFDNAGWRYKYTLDLIEVIEEV